MSAPRKELAVVGSEDFTLGFRLAGVRQAYAAADPAEVEARVGEALDRDDVGILIVNAADVEGLPSALKRRLLASLDPVVIQMGGQGSGDLREKVKRAIGIDLYKESE